MVWLQKDNGFATLIDVNSAISQINV
jgi:hypothetical protein